MKKIELWIGWLGAALTCLFLGGYTITINQLNTADFKEIFTPVFSSVMETMSSDEAMELFKSLGAWFGFTTLIVLGLTVVASVLFRYRNYRKKAGILYLVTGVCCLIGSQLIAFPIAFFFFVAGGLCFLRKPQRAVAEFS